MRRRFYGSPPINFNPLHPAPALPKPHCPLPRTKLASLVKGRWLDGKAQALTLLHLLAIRPPFLYCKLFCRQDGGIVTPPYPRPAPKIAPHSLSDRKCGGAGCRNTVVGVGASVHRQPFVPLHRATALCGCLYASLHNDSVRPLSCIHCTFMNALWALRPCKAFGRSFYKASVPYPQVAGSLTHQHIKSVTPLNEWGYTFWCRWRGSNPHDIATNGF